MGKYYTTYIKRDLTALIIIIIDVIKKIICIARMFKMSFKKKVDI